MTIFGDLEPPIFKTFPARRQPWILSHQTHRRSYALASVSDYGETLVYIITGFIHRGTSEENGGQGRIKDFIFEWFFFFLFPLMLLLKGFKLLWRKMFRSCFNAVGQELSRLFETCYPLIKEKLSHKRWKEMGQDESRGEYCIGESADKGDEESNGIGRNEYDGTRNDTTENDVTGNNVTGNYVTRSDNGASNVGVSQMIERHNSASYDVSGKDVIESNVEENALIENHVSGNSMIGDNMSEDSGDVRSSKSNLERHLSSTNETAESAVSRSDVARSSNSKGDVNVDVKGKSAGSVYSMANTFHSEVNETLNYD